MKLIQDQVDQERAVKNSLETRAGSVITSSGVLVTLVFAIVGTIVRPAGYHLSVTSRVFLEIAVAAFLAAAILAIMAARPRSYTEINSESLRRMAHADAWTAPASFGESKIAEALVGLIEGARRGNAVKANLLLMAVMCEVVAIGFLGVGVGAILVNV